MVRINFFRERVIGLNYRRMGQISGFMVMGLLGLFVWQKFLLLRAQGQVTRLQNEIQRFESMTPLAAGKNGSVLNLDPIQAVSSLLFKGPVWHQVLPSLSSVFGNGIWLERIEGETSQEGTVLTLLGTAYQPNLIPELMSRMRSLPIFSRVELLASGTTGNTDASYQFQIKGQIRGP